MRIEEQVCSLELAIRLKELKVKQDSLFYWTDCEIEQQTGKEECCIHKGNWEICFEDDKRCKEYSAFTVAELGKMLPDGIVSRRYVKIPYPSYFVYDLENKFGIFEDEIEVNARAKMLIFLIEEGYIKIGAGK